MRCWPWRARTSAKRRVENVEFLKGEIENIPLPDNSVDVIISNCVINLSGDKDKVLREAFRVLKPGGRFAVSDVVVRGEVPAELRRSMELWVGCIAGALEDYEYVSKLGQSGLRVHRHRADPRLPPKTPGNFWPAQVLTSDAIAKQMEGKFISAFIRASKPKLQEMLCSGLLRLTFELRFVPLWSPQTGELMAQASTKTKSREKAELLRALPQSVGRALHAGSACSSAKFCPASSTNCEEWSSAREARSTSRLPC